MSKRNPEEFLEAWAKAPDLVKRFVIETLEKEASDLRRLAAETDFATAFLVARMSQTDLGDGSSIVGAAVGSAMSALTQDSPRAVLAEYVEVAKKVLEYAGKPQGGA